MLDYTVLLKSIIQNLKLKIVKFIQNDKRKRRLKKKLMIIPERKLSIILLIIGTIGISFGGLIMRSVSTAD